MGWIYPPCVGIDITFDMAAGGSTPVGTQYLDALTHIYPDGGYDVEVYDKQQKLPFEPVPYISLDSNMPISNSYKLLIGQAYRIAAICSSADLAAKHISKVVTKMASRGFNRGRMLNTLTAWAQADPTIPGKTHNLCDVLHALTRRRTSWRS